MRKRIVVAVATGLLGLFAVAAQAAEAPVRNMTAAADSRRASHPARHAVDGSLKTRWIASSKRMPQRLTVDLRADRQVSRYSIAFYSPKGRRYTWTTFARKDGSSAWKRLHSRSGCSGTATQTLSTPVTMRYLRVRIERTSRGRASIREIRIDQLAAPAPITTPTPIRTLTFSPTPQPTPSRPASDGAVDVSDYGTDQAAVTAAAAAAVSQNKDLYFPAGAYTLSQAWSVPDGLRLYGDGGLTKKSWIKGYVLFGADQMFEDLVIGSKTGRALGLKNEARRMGGTAFKRVLFRGGAPQTVQLFGSGSSVTRSNVKLDGLTFDHCWFEASYRAPSAGDTRTIGCYTDRAMGQLARDVTFRHCWFDAPNEAGNYSNWGGLEIWSSHDDMSSYPSDPRNRGYDDWVLDSCVFEPVHGWNADFSGAQYVNDPDWGENSVTVRNCVFKGCGHLNGVDPTGTGYHVALQVEPGFDCVIENNVFGRSGHNGIKLIKNANHNVVRDNVFDYVSDPLGIDPYSWTVIVRADQSAPYNDNVISDNVLRLRPGEAGSASGQSWILGGVKNGNSVVRTTQPLIDYGKAVPSLVKP